jgi:hypothetical protein
MERMRVFGLMILMMLCLALPTVASNLEKGVSSSVHINAPPDLVWDAIRDQRRLEPDLEYSKVLSYSNNEALLEQKFIGLPVLGSAIALLKEREVPNQRIDYWLVKSNRFKAMEGSWVLSPVNGGKSTRLSLSSYLDVGIPFSRGPVNKVTQEKIKNRLSRVKTMAEETHRRMVDTGVKQM